METMHKLTEAERVLIRDTGTPVFPDGDYDIDEIQMVMSSLSDRIQPFASYVLNRVHVWLEGDGRWGGDDIFAVEWQDSTHGRGCVLTRRDDGATWIIDLWPKRYDPDVTQITISVYEPGDGSIKIARGDVSNGGKDVHGMRIQPGAVEGQMTLSAFGDLCRFAQAIKASMPESLLDVGSDPDFHAFLPMIRVVHAATIEGDLMLADGGLPGRLCQARQEYVTGIACAAVGEWMRDRLVPLADGLHDAGAEWGKAVVSYNDGDYFCCSVDFADGSKGYFSDNAASGFDEHSFVARIGCDEDGVRSVSVNVLHGGDLQDRMASIAAGEIPADFVYDFDARKPSFPGGRDGWTAMSLLLWQFVTDSNCALDEGEIKHDGQYWAVAGADEP